MSVCLHVRLHVHTRFPLPRKGARQQGSCRTLGEKLPPALSSRHRSPTTAPCGVRERFVKDGAQPDEERWGSGRLTARQTEFVSDGHHALPDVVLPGRDAPRRLHGGPWVGVDEHDGPVARGQQRICEGRVLAGLRLGASGRCCPRGWPKLGDGRIWLLQRGRSMSRRS